MDEPLAAGDTAPNHRMAADEADAFLESNALRRAVSEGTLLDSSAGGARVRSERVRRAMQLFEGLTAASSVAGRTQSQSSQAAAEPAPASSDSAKARRSLPSQRVDAIVALGSSSTPAEEDSLGDGETDEQLWARIRAKIGESRRLFRRMESTQSDAQHEPVQKVKGTGTAVKWSPSVQTSPQMTTAQKAKTKDTTVLAVSPTKQQSSAAPPPLLHSSRYPPQKASPNKSKIPLPVNSEAAKTHLAELASITRDSTPEQKRLQGAARNGAATPQPPPLQLNGSTGAKVSGQAPAGHVNTPSKRKTPTGSKQEVMHTPPRIAPSNEDGQRGSPGKFWDSTPEQKRLQGVTRNGAATLQTPPLTLNGSTGTKVSGQAPGKHVSTPSKRKTPTGSDQVTQTPPRMAPSNEDNIQRGSPGKYIEQSEEQEVLRGLDSTVLPLQKLAVQRRVRERLLATRAQAEWKQQKLQRQRDEAAAKMLTLKDEPTAHARTRRGGLESRIAELDSSLSEGSSTIERATREITDTNTSIQRLEGKLQHLASSA